MQASYTSQNSNDVHEPSSYWQETVTYLRLSDDLPSVIDVAIIGGGVMGAAISYWLARAGVRSVILERTRLAHEATGRNGGFVSIGPAESYPAAIRRSGHETAQAILNLTRENQALVRRILQEEDIACDYHEPGSLSLALDATHLTELAEEAMALQTDGVAAALLDRAQLQELIQTPLGRDIVGGRFMPEEGVVHPILFMQGLVQVARRSGVRTCATTVRQLVPHRGRVVVHTMHGPLQAETVIVAVNAWSGELLPQLAHVITPVRGQVLAYAPTMPVFTTGMSAPITPTGEYWQQRSDGTIILGGCRAVAPGSDIGVRLNQPTAEVQVALVQRITSSFRALRFSIGLRPRIVCEHTCGILYLEQVFPRLFPELRGLQVAHRWAGIMAFTRDYVPIVDRVPDMPGALVIGGFCGHGMPFALRLGQLMAEALTSRGWPSEILPFRLNRETLQEL